MKDTWTTRWDDRYSKEEYAFGITPNVFLKEQLDAIPPGKILFPAEGEGRNAVYAAAQGWEAYAFDISIEGKKKAMKLAEAKGVPLDYQVGELPDLHYEPDQFDAVALIYAHFPAEKRTTYHRLIDKLLKKGGMLIFEAFSKKHLPYRQKDPKVGGPTDLENLFSIEELKADFPHYHFLILEEKVIELHEGAYHEGTGAVIRFIARKNGLIM